MKIENAIRPAGIVTRLLLLIPPAFLIALKYDLPHILFITLLLSFLPFFVPPLPRNKRVVFVSMFCVLMLALLPDYMVTIHGARFALTDAILRSNFFVPLLLYAAGVMCTMRRTRELSAFIAMLCVFTILICGDIYNTRGIENTRFLFTTGLLQNYRIVYNLLVPLQGAGVILLLTADARYATHDSPRERSAAVRIRLFAILAVPFILFAFDRLYAANETVFKQMESYLYRNMRRARQRRNVSFAGNEANISQPFQLQNEILDDTILIRVKFNRAPGYLRGRCYDLYQKGGVWRQSPNHRKPSPLQDLALDPELALSYYPFIVGELNHQGPRMELFAESAFISDYLPIPGNTIGVEMVSESAELSEDGVFFPKKPSRTAGCFVNVRDYEPESASQFPADVAAAGNPRFRAIPPHLHRSLKLMRRMIFPKGETALTPHEKALAITEYLKSNFSYSLRPEPLPSLKLLRNIRPSDDPVEKFFFFTRSGHCELFASAAVLLMRSSGIPARYITGFVCTDLHPAGFYYSTGRNAHAWVEAWDSDLKKWRMYEPTPPVYSDILQNPPPTEANVFFQKVADNFSEAAAFLLRGYPGKYANRIFTFLADCLWFLISNPFGIFISLCLLTSLVFLFRFLRARKNIDRNYAPLLRRLYRAISKVERALSAKTGRRRTEFQSWSEWADMFRTECFSAGLLRLTEDYETLRYRAVPPDEKTVRQFEFCAKDLIREIRKTQTHSL